MLKACKQEHVSPLLRTLHWLPIPAHAEKKHKLLAFCQVLFLRNNPCLFVWSSSHELSIMAAPPLTQEYYAFHMLLLRPKHLDITLFLSVIPFLMKLDMFTQQLHLKPLWRPVCLKPTSASISPTPFLPQLFSNYFSWMKCCVCVCVCVCAYAHLAV